MRSLLAISGTGSIPSSMSGIVIDKLATEGEWLETGSPIYKIGDVTRLWVILDAYESDLAWLSYGQKVEFATDAYPGEVFQGAITFIASPHGISRE